MVFLLVGHTHDELDGVFSDIAELLIGMNVKDLDDFANIIGKLKVPTSLSAPQEVADMRAFIKDKFEPTEGITEAQVIQLFKDNRTGDVLLKSKFMSTDNDFMPPDGLVLLKKDAVPLPVQCDEVIRVAERPIDISGIKKTLAKMEALQLLTEQNKTWWDGHFNKITSLRGESDTCNASCHPNYSPHLVISSTLLAMGAS